MSSRNSIDISIARKIKSRRCELGLSQGHCAQALGISYQQFQKYEAATNRVSAGRLHHIAQVLETPIEYFFSDHNGNVVPFEESSRSTISLVREIARLSPSEQALAARLIKAIRENNQELN